MQAHAYSLRFKVHDVAGDGGPLFCLVVGPYVKRVATQRRIHGNEDSVSIQAAVVLVDKNGMHHVLWGQGILGLVQYSVR